jgi:hypothetical protein
VAYALAIRWHVHGHASCCGRRRAGHQRRTRAAAPLPSLASGARGGAEVQVHPAALPLHLIVISSHRQVRPVDQQRCVTDSVLDAAPAGWWQADLGMKALFGSMPILTTGCR